MRRQRRYSSVGGLSGPDRLVEPVDLPFVGVGVAPIARLGLAAAADLRVLPPGLVFFW